MCFESATLEERSVFADNVTNVLYKVRGRKTSLVRGTQLIVYEGTFLPRSYVVLLS
jgi:hypothetical protein